ncbi:hypothetical protein ACH47Z_33480 [Streptomyces sp. NPDC020192]|uniref:hypothetical protein n=1 Tax=Streptomyces sp. NPDC020192 TaxID=3365066 RepID=UPI0037A73410
MSSTRRTVLGAAMAAPLLAQFTGAASATAAAGTLGTVSDGWVEVRWTQQAQALLDRFQAAVTAVAPAQPVQDAQGTAIRFPVRFGEGDPSLSSPSKAHGNGRLDGGVEVRTPNGTVRVAGLEAGLQEGLASGKCVVNGVDVGHHAVLRPDLGQGRLTTESVPLGKPMKVRITEVPLRPTPELLETFTSGFGDPGITVDTVLAHLTAEGVYTPPTS